MFAKAGVDVGVLAVKLQDNAAKSFVDAWKDPGPRRRAVRHPGALNTIAEGVR